MAGNLSFLYQGRQPAGAVDASGAKIGGQFMAMLIRQREIGFIAYGDVLVRERAYNAADSLAQVTPVLSGRTQAGWEVDTSGPKNTYKVVNRSVNPADGFLVASALITGTGSQGMACEGFTGGFTTSWPGMPPSYPLRSEWLHQINEGFERIAIAPFQLPEMEMVKT